MSLSFFSFLLFFFFFFFFSFAFFCRKISMEQELYQAAGSGDTRRVRDILEGDPNLNVNWKNWHGWQWGTSLHQACANNHAAVISLLLAHPEIMVNEKNARGATPFMEACRLGRTEAVRLLLRDPRVSLEEPASGRQTPLFVATAAGHVDIIKWWMVSGRAVWLGDPGVEGGDVVGEANSVTPWHDAATRRKKRRAAHFLELLKANPDQARREVQADLAEDEAAMVFAVVIFLCDGLLRLRKDVTGHNQQKKKTEEEEVAVVMTMMVRFLRVMERVPMELQVIVCRRVQGLSGNSLPWEKTELSFRSLTRSLLS